MDDPAPVGARLLLPGTWELDASLPCATVLSYLASMVAAIRVPAFVLTDKAKVPAVLLLCSYGKPRITHEAVPKMKVHSSGIFRTWHGWCWTGDWMEKGLPLLCCTCENRDWVRPWAASCVLMVLQLVLQPTEGTFHVLPAFPGDSVTVEPCFPLPTDELCVWKK